MIKTLRMRFIAIASCCILIILVIVLTGFNATSYYSIYSESMAILTFITENNGRLPDENPQNEDVNFFVSREFLFQTRYFTVVIDENGNYISLNNEHIYNITNSEAISMSQKVLLNNKNQGHLNFSDSTFLYKTKQINTHYKLITFMDCTDNFYSLKSMCIHSIFIGAGCFLAFVFLVSLLSMKAIRPIAENYSKQKQFITNAGHELKTPLTIISANAEVIEAINGESEWTQSIRHQVERLTGLVNNLITIARLDESIEKQNTVMQTFNISEMIKNTADDFKIVAQQQGKTLDYNINEILNITGNEKTMKELITILFDNAIKYCDDNGSIYAELVQQKQHILFTISNSYSNQADCTRFFDRFYREDISHNSEKSGYGIGLSVAETIVQLHKGKINAYQKDKRIFFTVSI